MSSDVYKSLMNKWWIFNSKTVNFLTGWVLNLHWLWHICLLNRCVSHFPPIWFQKCFFHICHKDNFWTFQQTRFWRKHWVSYPEVTIVTADFHQAFQTSSSYFPPPAVTQRTASFLFITDEIRHNQVNQRDITQWSIISVCFQPDSL